jgi:hypothetical protein
MTIDKRIVFVLSQKGGVGKSTFSKMTIDVLRRINTEQCSGAYKVMAFDGDPKVGHLKDVYGIKDVHGKYDGFQNKRTPELGVVAFDAFNAKEGLMALDLLDMKPDFAVVDMPAGSPEVIKQLFGDIESFKKEYRQEGYGISVVIVLDALKTSAMSVKNIMQIWGAGVQYVVARNLSKGSDFEFFTSQNLFDDGVSAQDLVLQAGGKVIDLPALNLDAYALLDASSATFSNALTDNNPGYIPNRSYRTMVRRFLDDSEEELKKINWIAPKV